MATSIISKRHFVKFYLTIFGYVFFFSIMSLMVVALRNTALSTVGEAILILMSALLTFMAFYVIVRYYKNAPSIKIDDDSIIFNNSETYFWRDLEKIELTGKKPFKFIFGEVREATTLKFKGQTERYFFDDMYVNSHEIKSYIQQVAILKKLYSNSPNFKIDHSEIANENFVYFKGHQLLCIEGIMFWGFILPDLFMIIKSIIILSVGGITGFLIFGINVDIHLGATITLFWRFD